jgi:predicted amidohydrolase YtcJ
MADARSSLPRPADAVFTGGFAYSAGWRAPRALGVAVRDGAIVAVASDAELSHLVGPRTRVVDLGGRLLMPGFIDAHAHPVQGGLELLQCNLTGARGAGDCVAIVAAYAAAHPEREWITGGGWSMSHFPGGTPAAGLLDAVVPDRPVFLMNRDHHGAWVNSAALRLAGIDRDTPDPSDGRIERDAAGNPTGTLHEGASLLVQSLLPAVSLDEAVAGVARGQEEMFGFGVTGWADAWVGKTGGMESIFDAYMAALDRDVLRARVTGALWWERGAGLEQVEAFVALRGEAARRGRGDVFRADAVKIMVDGVAENFSAAMSLPYRDAHGHVTDNLGHTFLTPEALNEASIAVDAAGFQLHLHTLGDRAVTVGLDAIEAVKRANGPAAAARATLAHLQVVSQRDVERFAPLGAIANLQMLWAAVDEQLEDLTFPFLDPALIARHYPFGDLVRAGAQIACGSDWPVSTPNPWEAIAVGLTRAEEGREADPRIGLHQRLDLPTMLDACTAGSAHSNGRGDTTGRLEVGFAADLVVLDDDPFTVRPDRLGRVRVGQTWVGGAQVAGAQA